MRERGGEESRLEEWLKSYGISRETNSVKGAADHVQRIRNTNQERAEDFKFTFKIGTEKSKREAYIMQKRVDEEKAEREVRFQQQQGKSRENKVEKKTTEIEAEGEVIVAGEPMAEGSGSPPKESRESCVSAGACEVVSTIAQVNH